MWPILPGSLARDLLILDSIILSRTWMLLSWQLHALQELPLCAEVSAGEMNSKLAAMRAMRDIVESVVWRYRSDTCRLNQFEVDKACSFIARILPHLVGLTCIALTTTLHHSCNSTITSYYSYFIHKIHKTYAYYTNHSIIIIILLSLFWYLFEPGRAKKSLAMSNPAQQSQM